MKTSIKLLCSLGLGLVLAPGLFAQTTAFTYQGRLAQSGSPANGIYDMQFSLFNVVSGGAAIAGPLSASLGVTGGLFTASLDFTATPVTGQNLWLQIAVRTNGVGVYSNLTPRQPITSTPYAIRALNAGTAGTAGSATTAASATTATTAITATTATTANSVAPNGVNNAALQNASITGAKIANGQVVRSLNGLFDDLSIIAGPNITLTPGAGTLTLASPTWSLTGNAGTTTADFLGTTDNTPLELRANGSRGLKLEYASRSSGFPFLFIQRAINVAGGYWGNTITSDVIGATIAGGGDETGSILFSSAYPNTVNGDFGSVGGGYNNTAGYGATVPGGYNNSATGEGSFAAGRRSHVTHNGSFMWCDGTQDAFSTANNQFGVLAAGGVHLWHGAEGVNIDQFNGNNGDVNYSLRFGVGSGEAIGSKRTAGGNLYGLDFYTAYANRMSIANWGGVGINTTAPEQQLDVNGWYMQVRGAGNEKAYIGGDGFGGDVQIGSFNPGIVNVALYNPNNGYMNLYVKSITITGGADLAEPFEMSHKEIPQGAVVVIDEENPGQLKMSAGAYDTHVAGIVSGAGGINPGIQLKQQGALEGGQNVALTGRVYALADATSGPIKPGDLLTTSAKPGYCMKAGDRDRAQGAILGKAMTGLKEGQGKVLVLVTLQ